MLSAIIALSLSAVSCVSVSHPDSTPSLPSAPTTLFIDYETVDDWPTLVGESQLIAVVDAESEATAVATGEPGISDYTRRVRVIDVIKGPTATASTELAIVRAGLSGDQPFGGPPGHEVYGPLALGRHLLFLIPGGRPHTWSVVGHWQGDMLMAESSVSRATFPAFRGADVARIKELVGSVVRR